MQHTSGSSSCCRTDVDEPDVDVAVDEVALDEVAVVVVSFFFMVWGNCCVRLICLIGRVCGSVTVTVGDTLHEKKILNSWAPV